MGILNFYSWIRTRYPACFVKNRTVYNHIYVDVNHMLHSSISDSKTEDQFISKLYTHLDILFSSCTATDSVVLAVDGVSPWAKIALQRKRRLNHNVSKDLDSLHLTPGTQLTENLTEHLKKYCKILESKYRFIKPVYYVSGSEQPDEGELKIFRHILHNTRGSHLVVGNDADLVSLATASYPVQDIDILIKHTGSYHTVSVSELIKLFTEDILCRKIKNQFSHMYRFYRSDFTVLSTMAGNDYLPKLGATKFETLWDAYINTGGNLVKNNVFNIKNLKIFMNNIRTAPQYRKFNEKNYDESNVENYIRGLLWCLNMYSTGRCPMYSYMFEGKPPKPVDIVYFINNSDKAQVCCTTVPTTDDPPIPVSVYTLIVMPKKAKHLVPEKYHNFMENELKYIYADEECSECTILKKPLSELHKELIKLKKENSDTTYVREQIGTVQTNLNIHKKLHSYKFSKKDIEYILKICKTL